MPEIAEPPVQVTKLQADIAATTNAAVQDTAFGPDFDAEVDAAIAKDAGVKPPEPKPEPEAKPAKEAKQDKPKAEKSVMDIPDVLLKKEKAEAKHEAPDAEREKAIKEQTAGMSPKAADRFRAIEAKAHAAEQKAARAEKLEAELGIAQERLKNAVDSSQFDALKKQSEELDEIVQKNALTDHPRFKAKFDAEMAKKLEKAKGSLSKEASAEVEALLSLQPTAQRNRRLNEIKGELEEWEQDSFRKAVDEYDDLNQERTRELSNWKVNKLKLAELTEQEKAQATQHQKATIDKAIASVIPRFTDEEKGVELFRKADGNDEWNKTVDARIDTVKKLTAADLSREDIAEMAAWAVGSQEYRKLFLTQRALLQRLQDEISSLKSGEPDLGEGGLHTDGDDDESGSAVDVMVRMAKKAGAVQ